MIGGFRKVCEAVLYLNNFTRFLTRYCTKVLLVSTCPVKWFRRLGEISSHRFCWALTKQKTHLPLFAFNPGEKSWPQTTHKELLFAFVEIDLVVPRRLPFHLVWDGAFAFVATKWCDVRYILREVLILWAHY